MKPWVGYRVISCISGLLLVVSFVLFILVALSLPILKSIYLLKAKSTSTGQPATSIATELRFGVWGVCTSSAFGQRSCFGPQLGYDVPDSFAALSGVSPEIISAVERGLLFILILHPIVAAMSCLGFILSPFLAEHAVAILALVVAILTAIVGTVVFAIDLALVIVARNQIANMPDLQFDVEWGDGVWMILVAVIMTWLAVVLLSARACYCCGVRKRNLH